MRNFYAGSNSSLGFYSLFEEVLSPLDHLYILKGGPGTGKSTLIKNVGSYFEEKGLDVEYIHCSSDTESLDGVILPALKVGIVDGTAPHTIDPKYPGVVDRIVNLGDFRDDSKLSVHKEAIKEITDDVSLAFSNAYKCFADSKKAHDDLEEIYISALDFEKANEVTEKLSESLFASTVDSYQTGEIKSLFFGANTPSGPVHYYDNLTENCTKRVILKGRAGSGKSTLMKRLAKAAQDSGHDVELYYCSFDPNSVDMVLVPSLNVAVLDGTAPHVMEPTRTGDEILDMFESCMDTSIEIDRKEEIDAIEGKYKALMQDGISYLKEAKSLHDQLEAFYVEAMDFKAVEQKQNEIIEEILELMHTKIQ